MESKAINQIDSWLNGVGYEVAFWGGVFLYKNKRTEVLSRLNKEIDLPGLRKNERKWLDMSCEIKMLDVGCGMSYATGSLINGKRLSIDYVDPLAPFYNKILKKYPIELPKIEFGMVEYLRSFYSQNSIDLITILNALDHSFDPIKGITECLQVLKQNGILYLYHGVDEAVHENYMGFHQYNLSIKNGHLHCWNKTEDVDITEYLSEQTTVECFIKESHVIAVIKKCVKTAENVDATNQEPYLSDRKQLCEQIMYTIEKLNTPSQCLKSVLSLVWLKIMHATAKIISPQIKSKVKDLLRKS